VTERLENREERSVLRSTRYFGFSNTEVRATVLYSVKAKAYYYYYYTVQRATSAYV